MLIPRILTALVLLPLMLLMLFAADDVVWALFAGVLTLAALWEFGRLCALPQETLRVYLGAAGLFLYCACSGGWMLPAEVWGAVLLFWLAGMPLWLWRRWPLPSDWRGMAAGWLMIVPFWFALTGLRPELPYAAPLLAVMALVWVADVFAYFVGKKWGKRRMAPSISPNKSWEGAAGGMAAVVLYFLVAHYAGWLGFSVPVSWLVPLAVVLALLGMGGDLLESLFKRAAGVKDSSNLLPGHGGVYDRVDSLIPVVCVYAAVLALF